jgi:hypothetical protein
MTIPLPLLDLPLDSDRNGTNAVSGFVLAPASGTILFDTPNHDSTGGYAGVGDPIGTSNAYPDPGFEGAEEAWITTVGSPSNAILNDLPHTGSSYLNIVFGVTGEAVIISTDTGLAVPGTTPVHLSLWGHMPFSDGTVSLVGRVVYDDASHDDTTIATVTVTEADYVFREADLTVNAAKTIDAVQLRVVATSIPSFAFYRVDDLVIDAGPDAGGGATPDLGKLWFEARHPSFPPYDTINLTDTGAIAMWIQADQNDYWEDVAATDPFPLLTITTASGEADRVAVELAPDTQELSILANTLTSSGSITLDDTDVDWHLLVLNYDGEDFAVYLDNVLVCSLVAGAAVPTDGDVYLLSSPYHDRAGGHVSNVTTYSDALTPPQMYYLFNGSFPPPPPRIGGLLRTGLGDLNIALTRTNYPEEPIVGTRQAFTEPIEIDRAGTPAPIVVTSTIGEV